MGAATAEKVIPSATVAATKKPRKKAKAPPSSSSAAERELSPSSGLQCRVVMSDMRKAIARMATVVDRKSTMPMLHHVMLVADKERVSVAATDLTTWLTVQLTGASWTSGVGSVAIECKRLADLLKVLPDGEVTIAKDRAHTTRIEIGACAATVVSLPAVDFPTAPSVGDAAWHAIDSGALRQGIDDTLACVCRDETRFHLNGVFLESDGQILRMVSTDGHRLAKSQRACPSSLVLETGRILPEKACRELRRLLTDGACEIAVTRTHIFVRQDNWTLATHPIDAQFPPYEQVIPTEYKRLVTVYRDEFVTACKRARVLSSETRGVRLTIGHDAVTLTSDHPDAGELRERLRAEHSPAKQPFDVGFDPDYMLDLLQTIEGEQCVLGFGSELDPISIRSLDDAAMRAITDAEFLGIVMPMRI